ncbi:hypothetical protein T484DRAFT_1856676, partial [Baffinella frigidus]
MNLRELERCTSESVGLSYAFFAAQKYGYRPFPSKIPREIFEELLKLVKDTDRELLTSAFKLDDNALVPMEAAPKKGQSPPEFAGPSGPCYVLQPASTIKGFWGGGGKFEVMQTALREAAGKLWPEGTATLRSAECKAFAKKFTISVTEEEMSRGMLFLDTEHQEKKTLLVERTFEGLEEAKDGHWIDTKNANDAEDKTATVVDEEAQQLLREQIAMIPPHVPRLKYDSLKWGPGVVPTPTAHGAYLRKMCDDFCLFAYESMVNGLRALAVQPDQVVDEARHHLQFAVVRKGKFCPTSTTVKVVGAVQGYLSRDGSGQAFVVSGRSGAGKTYLMSQLLVEHIQEKAGKGCVVIRFLGTSPASSAVQPLLSSVCEQLRRCYGKDKQVPSDFKELKAYFLEALAELPSEEQPLSLFIDSVDQLDDSNAGRRLEWLPVAGLSPHVRLVLSTLPDHPEFQCRSLLIKGLGLAASSCMVEVETISEHGTVLAHLLKLQGRTLTLEQAAAVDKAYRLRGENDGAGTPLFLTIVAQCTTGWTSYDGVKFPLKSSVRGLIKDLFERLEATHGTHLVRAVLAYLTLCRRSGVSETELVHLLSLDDAVLADVYEWWVPPMRTCPPLVLTMLLAELAPYLSRRGDGSGQELFSWYHRQFWEAAEAYLFGESEQAREGFVSRQAWHQQLADFFAGTWAGAPKPYSAWLAERVQRHNFFPGETTGDRMVPAQPLALEGRFDEGGASLLPNTRRITELVHHATRAGDVRRAAESLCSVEYVAAKFAVGQGGDLLREYAEAIEICGGSPSPEQQRLEQFKNFVGRHRALLRAQRGKLAALPFQLAAQEPEVSQVWAAAASAGFPRRVEWPLRPRQIDPCLLTIGEHEGQVKAVAFSRCGKWVVSGSGDMTAKICHAGTGEVKCTLAGHSGGVCSVAISADGKRVVSGSSDRTVKIWDVETGAE